MLQEITLGQFFPGNSILHELDPRTKIFSLFVLMILIFAADGIAAYTFLTIATSALIFLSKIPPLTVLKSVKPLSWIILFTLLIHLVSHEGEVLAEFFIFKITDTGLSFGILISSMSKGLNYKLKAGNKITFKLDTPVYVQVSDVQSK